MSFRQFDNLTGSEKAYNCLPASPGTLFGSIISNCACSSKKRYSCAGWREARCQGGSHHDKDPAALQPFGAHHADRRLAQLPQSARRPRAALIKSLKNDVDRVVQVDEAVVACSFATAYMFVFVCTVCMLQLCVSDAETAVWIRLLLAEAMLWSHLLCCKAAS